MSESRFRGQTLPVYPRSVHFVSCRAVVLFSACGAGLLLPLVFAGAPDCQDRHSCTCACGWKTCPRIRRDCCCQHQTSWRGSGLFSSFLFFTGVFSNGSDFQLQFTVHSFLSFFSFKRIGPRLDVNVNFRADSYKLRDSRTRRPRESLGRIP